MTKRSTKFIAFGLSIGQSVLGLMALLLLARFEGPSPAYSLYVQVSAFTLAMTSLLGIEASRHQMVHWRLNREPDEAITMIRSLFSLLLISRASLGLLFCFAPAELLAFLTNAEAQTIQDQAALLRLLGVEQFGQLLLDVALFAGITRGWLISAPATAFAIYLLRVIGLVLVKEDALFASLCGIVIGEVLGAGYLLYRCYGKEERQLTKPKISPSAFVRGLRIALPTSLLGFTPALLIWGRNYYLLEVEGERIVGLFGFIQPLLMTVGLVFAITLNTSEGILVSDRSKPLEERRQMVLSGFVSGLTWALGSALIVALLAPWIVRVAFAFGGGKMTSDDLSTLASILRFMCLMVGGATLHAFAVKVAMGLAQNKRFFVINLFALALGAVTIAGVQGVLPHVSTIELVAAVSGVVGLLASTIFFLRVGEWSIGVLAKRMARPIGALLLVAALGYGLLAFEVASLFEASPWLDLVALGVSGILLLGVYLGVAWGIRRLR